MSLQPNLVNLWSSCMGHKIRPQYVPKNAMNPQNISSTKKDITRKAIVWLISKSPHSPEEIADHYEISSELVSHLLEELKEKDTVIKESAKSSRYTVNTM